MNMHILSHLSRSVTILLLMLGLAFADDAPQLQQIKHLVLSPDSEQIIMQLNGSYSPKAFTLKGQSPRVVFDFANMTQGRGVGNILKLNGPFIKTVRVGMHADTSPKTRVVFDLKTLKGVNYTQQFDKKTATLTITFSGPHKAVAKPETVKEQPSEKRAIPRVKESKAVSAEPAPATPPVVAPPTAPPPATEPIDPPPAKPTKGSPDEATVQPGPSKSTPEHKQTPHKETATTQEAKPGKPVSKTAENTNPAAEAATEPSPAPEIEAAPVHKDPELESVKFDPSSPKGEMVMFKLNGFYPPTVHGVEEGIPRVICDFNNTTLTGNTKNRINTKGKFVKVIRVSKTKKPEKVRVVIDLEPNRSYDLQQVFFKDDNLFVIIVNTIQK